MKGSKQFVYIDLPIFCAFLIHIAIECCVPTMLTMRARKCSSSENPKAIFLHSYYLNDLNIGKQTYHSFGTKLRQCTKYWNPCQYNPVYQREQLYTSVPPPENAFDDYKKKTLIQYLRSIDFSGPLNLWKPTQKLAKRSKVFCARSNGILFISH